MSLINSVCWKLQHFIHISFHPKLEMLKCYNLVYSFSQWWCQCSIWDVKAMTSWWMSKLIKFSFFRLNLLLTNIQRWRQKAATADEDPKGRDEDDKDGGGTLNVKQDESLWRTDWVKTDWTESSTPTPNLTWPHLQQVSGRRGRVQQVVGSGRGWVH